ncbi:MAG: hypothetical protein ABIF71_04335 [Planctomycetota bacterium]
MGYGTNHLTIELSGLTAYARVFRDDPGWQGMDPGGPAFEGWLAAYLDRFMAYMDDGGYWPESDGPAQGYNSLTANSLLRAAIDLGRMDRQLKRFRAAARFHVVNTLPDLMSTGLMDGRNGRLPVLVRTSFCGLIPEGRPLVDAVARLNLAESTRPEGRVSGETMNELLTDLLAGPWFAPAGPSVWEPRDLTHTVRNDWAVLKRGPWIAAACNIPFRARPEGHWNLDYQNLFMLHHCEAGTILNGNHGKNDPEMATFHKRFDTFDGKPVPPVWVHLPGAGRLETRGDGFRLWRDYRGFEGTVAIAFADDHTAVIRLSAAARLAEYPVMCALQPAVGFGGCFHDASGRAIAVTAAPFVLNGADLGGALVFAPARGPGADPAAEGRPVRMSLPEDAMLVWPYKPWDCYNLKTDRHTHPSGWVPVVHVPVGPAGAELTVRV